MREALHLDSSNPAPAVMSPAELAEAEARVVARLASTNRTHIYREQVVREWARELEGVSEIGPLLALVDHTMDEGRALVCRYAADRDGTPLYATPSPGELRRLLGDHAVAEAHAADSATPHGAAVDPGVRPTAEAPISAPTGTPPPARHPARKRCGYVVFEAPRSVALYVAGACDHARAAQLEAAHRAAVREVAGALLDTAGVPRHAVGQEAHHGTKGEVRLATKVFLPATDLYAWSRAAGALYSAALRAHAAAAGFAFADYGGGFELVGAEVLVGPDGDSLLDATARRGSRPVFGADPEAPAAGGRDGIAPHIWARVGRPAATPQSVPLDGAVAAALRTGGPLAGHAVWTAADFLAGLDTHLPQGCSTAGMLGAAAALERRGEVVALSTASSRRDGAGVCESSAHDLAGEHTVDPMARFALTSVVADEEAVLASCARPHPGLLSARAVRRAIRRTERTHGVQLSDEQRRAAEEVLADGRAISAVTGVPGAGKTSVLAAIAEGFAGAGYEVTGLAHTGVASQTVGRQATIASSTIDSFLFRLSHGFTRIGVRSVVICDEASQVDTARMRALVAETEAAGAKLVLVGDPHQQGSVEAGGLFAEIVWRHGSAVLSQNRRQRQVHEAEAVAALRQGEAAEAVAAYCDHDQVRVTRTHAEMLQGAVDEYAAHRVNGSEAVLIAQRRTDVAALNVVARSCLVHAGLVDDARGTTLQGEVPVRVAAGDSLRMTSRLQVVLVRLARRTKIGDVVFDKGVVVTAHLDGPVVTITSRSAVATANRHSLPRPRQLREKEVARCGASGISPAALVALSGLGSIRGAKSLRRGSLLEVTDVAGGVVSLRAQELEIVLACRA
ncbi:MAG: AAA family ATPase, partial [Actinomycetota bacterium]|nr:AAA family ATPase [Actinomycetota bacterium]